MAQVLIAGGTAFALALVLAHLCKPLALRSGIVASPGPDRWHHHAVPLLGGVAIVIAVLVAMAIAPVRSGPLLILLAGACALAVVGLADDIRPFGPQSKVVLQILAASAMVALGFELRLSGYPALDVLLTLMWIVGITNAFNLLDNMDGLAAGIAAIAAGFRMAFFLHDGDLEAAQLAAAVVGACAGFLVHNFHPASIFMGDAGSLFLGFLVAGLSLVGTWPYSRSTVSVLVFPVLLLLVPVFDTAFVAVVRTLAGRPISQGGRDHTSHRLVASGLSERQAVLLLYGVAALSGVVAFRVYLGGLPTTLALVAFLAMGLTLLGVYLGRVKIYVASSAVDTTRSAFVRLVDGFPFKRQVATVFIDACLIVLAYYCAYRLRFEQTYAAEEPQFVRSLPIVLATQLAAFAAFRVYQGVWRYTGLPDAVRLAKAVSAGSAASVLALLLLFRFEGYSRALFVMDWALLLLLVGGARLSFRLLDEMFRGAPAGERRVLVYGAGDDGVLALRAMRNNPDLARLVVGFIDDDPWKGGTQVHGAPVLGTVERVAELVRAHAIEEVVVASTQIPLHRLRQLSDQCATHNVAVVRASLVVSGAIAS